jgi:hypothetical protein
MRKLKIQIKSLGGSVLFEYEAENNTIKKTVEKAINSSANLRYANLRSADLRYANLRYANLRYADLRYADLRSANLRSADLRYANLRYADLSYADLRSANLRSADLRSADLRSANLSYANLSSADLRYADLRSADLKRIKHLWQIIPEEGSFIAWKKCSNQCLVKLEIPAEAKRHNSLGGRKCRASYVKTVAIWDKDGNSITECKGSHNSEIIYKVGRLTKPDKYDANPLIECSNGIHFFITKQEALEW